MIAAENNYTKIVKLLLEQGIDTNIKDDYLPYSRFLEIFSCFMIKLGIN